MKLIKKTAAILLSACMLVPAAAIVSSAESTQTGETDYTITSPYDDIDWDTYNYYLANLHTHCTASDGRVDLPDMIELYYKAGYDILSLTDHGVINNGWNQERKVYPPFNLFQKLHNMSDEDYERITTGSDRDGRGMTDVVGGIEMNMATLTKTHVNGYFTEYGSGLWGKENDYESAPAAVEASGKGFTVLNHVGDWVNSNNFPERSHHPMFIEYFANIFVKNPSCLGMEIINSTDNVTRADKALWDELLQVVIPKGRNIIAFADDDSEYANEVGRSFEMFVLPENNLENVKQAMQDGAFFACSRFAKTDIAPDFEGNGLVPLVSKIDVDQKENSITLTLDDTRDCQSVEWIANGEIIATGNSIDLNDYEDQLGCYIRFQLKGEGGITYSQAFTLSYEGRADKEIPHYAKFDGFFGDIFKKLVKTRFFAIIMKICEKFDYDIVGAIAKY